MYIMNKAKRQAYDQVARSSTNIIERESAHCTIINYGIQYNYKARAHVLKDQDAFELIWTDFVFVLKWCRAYLQIKAFGCCCMFRQDQTNFQLGIQSYLLTVP